MDGIRVNGIAPSIIKTEMAGGFIKDPNFNPKRVGTVDHVAAMAATICSPTDGSFCNGEIFKIHGGFPSIGDGGHSTTSKSPSSKNSNMQETAMSF